MPAPHIAEFWRSLLATIPSSTEPVSTAVEGLFDTVDSFDVTFAGCHGDPIKAWYSAPRGSRTRGVVVEFLGYGRGRGLPFERLQWNAAGYAHLLMDTRGQGSQYGAGGQTGDPHGAGPHVPGFMTKGIESAETLYFARLIADGFAAVSAAQNLSGHDASHTFLAGNSQGGGIALAVAGLLGPRSAPLGGVMANVPLLCDIEASVATASDGPYLEVRQYVSTHRLDTEATFRVLEHVDVAELVDQANAPLLLAHGELDTLCPAAGVRRAFSVYGSNASPATPEKEIITYRFNGHDGGDAHQTQRQLEWLRNK
ncbi:acetylxylan esterase [Timonella senegalensis]|uniref:acetylxylan esterase n=1 Tax=Timonella senegalensis TaxID=1465825 RepID=UPI002FDCBE27